jgi:hypothetical protein
MLKSLEFYIYSSFIALTSIEILESLAFIVYFSSMTLSSVEMLESMAFFIYLPWPLLVWGS